MGRGLYDLPRVHPWFGTLSPQPEKVAEAVAAREHGGLRVNGAAAANLLGLSNQVPGKLIYQTQGRSRKFTVAGQEVKLRHRSVREMAMSAKPTGLVVSALRSLGKQHVTTHRLEKLRNDFSAKDRRVLLKELPLAPVWMHPFLRFLAKEK